MNTIEELYYGNIQPHVRKNQDAELVALIDRHESWLKEHLGGEALDTLDKLTDCYAEFNGNTAYECFRDGFRLGAQLIIAVINGGEETDE